MSHYLVLILVVFSSLVSARVFTEEDVDPSLEMGADVYYKRCTLCHGNDGMGDGLIPLKIQEYPSTELISAIKDLSEESIKKAVVYGGTTGNISTYMPPMGNDLTWTQTESVVKFLLLMKSDYDKAVAMVKKTAAQQAPSKRQGQQLFSAQCVLCHGKFGDGKGRMAKILKTPPPANLIISRLPDSYLQKIISGGGQSVGRSPNMPPWADQMSKNEINSIILYLNSIRN